LLLCFRHLPFLVAALRIYSANIYFAPARYASLLMINDNYRSLAVDMQKHEGIQV
jgi:hypothetical protein